MTTSIKAVRDFVDEQVKKTRPDLSAYKFDVFGNNDNVNSAEMQTKYNLIINRFRIEEEGGAFRQRVYECNLDIWKINGYPPLASFDQLVDDVENIADNLIDFKAISKSGCIRKVELIDYEAIEEPSSESTYKIRLAFEIFVGI